MEKIIISVVDDHIMVIEGMRAILKDISFIELAGTAANAFEAMELIRRVKIDIAIVDINLPDVSGIELTAKIRSEFPSVKVIALSTFKERSYISQMIQKGASGYLVKSASREEIEEALLTVYEGKLYLSLDINKLDKSVAIGRETPVISRREKEILKLIAEGLTNTQIARQLYISLHTVDSHRKNLLTKFKVNNTAGLIREAVKQGLV